MSIGFAKIIDLKSNNFIGTGVGLHGEGKILYAWIMKRDRQIDWSAIKTAYITGEESQRELAERFGVSRSFLSDKCRREGWVQERQQYNAKTVQQAVRQASRTRARDLAKLIRSSDILDDVVLELFERLSREGLKAISASGAPGRELESLSRALLNNDELKRRLSGKMMPRDEAKLQLEREKLELEKERLRKQDEGGAQMAFEVSDELKELAQ